ncbi:hypothetical protein CIHG_02286 [Coccidioides immitis H538.4]|uniref:Uncharacterized protein n=3 Tax=Coccidioides immitis TaxID=5501 RepID=A0A0J8R9Y7_COCIT|nr:hypothetical protein CIRG_00456 [Coccidioides immitis RMSCC 2394]KMU80623.1 hypothetical protein CISG_08612 [Coccidioides immitis RMSCC 3703]KMU84502.1 hypothetical protein CIHG_02286 [Coccidioides immitis H538.4]
MYVTALIQRLLAGTKCDLSLLFYGVQIATFRPSESQLSSRDSSGPVQRYAQLHSVVAYLSLATVVHGLPEVWAAGDILCSPRSSKQTDIEKRTQQGAILATGAGAIPKNGTYRP